jgi:hypothetical protein
MFNVPVFIYKILFQLFIHQAEMIKSDSWTTSGSSMVWRRLQVRLLSEDRERQVLWKFQMLGDMELIIVSSVEFH